MECWYALPGDAQATRRVWLESGPSTDVETLSSRILAHAKNCEPTEDDLDLWFGAMRLSAEGRDLRRGRTLADCGVDGQGACSVFCLTRMLGGIDFQNRAGSKPGSGGVMSSDQQNLDRRERLRKLALETVDLNKDPYFMRNHLGTYECKLCLTLHNTEGNYLAHTQGKRHQQNLARRAFKDQRDAPIAPTPQVYTEKRHTIKIGRPGYKVTKSRDVATKQRSLLFEIDYPESDESVQPRHRFMSAYEQRIDPPDKNYQYLLFACEPYETVAFKIPNCEVDKDPQRFFTNWDVVTKKFTLTLMFLDEDAVKKPDMTSAPKKHRANLSYDTRY